MLTDPRSRWALTLAAAAGLAGLLLGAYASAPYRAVALLHVSPPADPRAALREPGFLEEVVREAGLDGESAPDYRSGVGRLRARMAPADPPGVEPSAGHGPRLVVNVFELPAERRDLRFALRVGEAGQYTLLDEAGMTLATGRVGRRLHVPAVALRLRVSEIAALSSRLKRARPS